MSIRTIITGIRHGQAKEQNIHAGERNDLHVSVHDGEPPLLRAPNRKSFFSQLVSGVGDGTGLTNMNATISDSGTDGACADHTGPEFTFTAAGGGLEGATQIQITDAGAGGNGIIGLYRVITQTSDTSLTLDRDPTNGTDETGLDWEVPSTAVFKITAAKDYDIRIMKLVIVMGDGAITHDKFAGIAAISNGWDLETIERGVATSLINKAKTTGQVIIQSATSLAWGDAATSFELTNYDSNNDAAVTVIPTGDLVPGGIRIGYDSQDSLRSTVRDDLTGLSEFTVRAIGYKHHK